VASVPQGSMFDGSLEWLKALVEIMNRNDLAELSLEEQGRKIRLRKGMLEPARVTLASGYSVPAAEPRAAATAASPASASRPAERPQDIVEITSPMVGTFYRAPSPEADPFVEVGDAVKEDTTLCIIEAMKVMNEIKAEMDGIVQEILVSNGEAVEFGQPLFLIRRA